MVAPRTFSAEYHSICPECKDDIEPGESVRWMGDRVAHEDHFVMDYEPKWSEEPPKVCDKCYQTFSVSGSCGCEE